MATGNSQQGFTLIELLVVITLTAIVLMVAALRISSFSHHGANALATQLQQRFITAEHEAILLPGTLKFQLTPKGYQFLIKQNNEWRVLQNDHLSEPDIFPRDVVVKLQPSFIIFSPDGEVTSFSFSINEKNSDEIYNISENN